jgi:colanic acid/amylovoran biosynthesis protein
MRIIVITGLNSGSAEYRNLGDVAMLQVAVSRLLELWPDSSVAVLTDSPADLARYCPGAEALNRAGCACLGEDRTLFARLEALLPKWAAAGLSALHRMLGNYTPRLLEWIIRLKLSIRDRNGRGKEFRLFLDALKHCDLLIVSGAGGFADSCLEWNALTLDTIRSALLRNIPVVMLGQGMGPLTDPTVLSRAHRLFPKIKLIGLRGTRGGEELLNSLEVPPESIETTGDDTVDLAYAARNDTPGNALGINLRVAFYAEVADESLNEIRSVLQRFSRERAVPLLPVPIAFHEWAGDHESIRKLLKGIDDRSDGGLSLDSPQKLIAQIGRCRVVVTGAYHAAVFALAQGIPAVCLSTSDYYAAKFEGLQDLFGGGCSILRIREPRLQERLSIAIEDAWQSADNLREPLLAAARSQIELSRGVCRRIKARCDRLKAPTLTQLRKNAAV